MHTVNIHEAKTHLSRLLEEASRGQEIVIAKSGKPVARLTGVGAGKPIRRPGALKGKIRIAENFDEPLPEELLDAFEGKA